MRGKPGPDYRSCSIGSRSSVSTSTPASCSATSTAASPTASSRPRPPAVPGTATVRERQHGAGRRTTTRRSASVFASSVLRSDEIVIARSAATKQSRERGPYVPLDCFASLAMTPLVRRKCNSPYSRKRRAARGAHGASIRAVAVDATLVAIVLIFAQSVLVALVIRIGRNMRQGQAKRRRLRRRATTPAGAMAGPCATVVVANRVVRRGSDECGDARLAALSAHRQRATQTAPWRAQARWSSMSSRHPPAREAHAVLSPRYYLVLSDANITVAQIAPVKIFFMRDARRTPGAPGFEWSPRREAAGSQGETFLSSDSKDALWAKFFMGAPRRQRQSVERYNIVKRA